MALQALFNRSPVLPVDATISLARYLNTIRQTHKHAITSKQNGDFSRATLLHVRVLQLVCKTLPSHPDYTLPENAAVVRELRAVSHISFREVERLATLLTSSAATSTTATAPTSAATSATPVADTAAASPSAATTPRKLSRGVRRTRKLVVSTGLFDLFERIAGERTAVGEATIGLLTARLDAVTADAEHDDIVALIIPPQAHGPQWSGMRYERDVTHLLEIKELVIVGLISLQPRVRRNTLPLQAAKALSIIQSHFSNATAIVVAPRDSTCHCAFFTLSDKAMAYVSSVDGEIQQDIIPQGLDGAGEPIITQAHHVEDRDDATPTFKLYDLRPLEKTREEHGRENGERNA